MRRSIGEKMTVSMDETIIGFIGTGVMGTSMAGHLLKAGFKLHVFTRTREKADALCADGAVWEESVKALSGKCSVIITMVGFPSDVQEIYLGNRGIFNNAGAGTVAIDMTTSSPELSVTLHETGRANGISTLDAPVSGGDIGARNATLSIMVGGEPEVFDAMLPIFDLLGENVILQGPAGSGQHTKLANQIAIASGMIAVCESLTYAKKAGLDPETVLKSIGAGAAGSWSLNNLGPRMIKGDYEPGFYVKHFIKDLNLAAESSKALGLDTPGLNLTKTLYDTLAEKGCENDGTQALYKLFDF